MDSQFKSVDQCHKKRIIILVVFTFLLLLFVSNGHEYFIKDALKIRDYLDVTEQYGMPTMTCEQINAIRVDSKLPPIDC
jgi:hypothetical protein